LFLPALVLGACSSLPHDGPPGRAFHAEAQKPDQHAYALIDLDYRVAEQVAAGPSPSLSSLAAAGSNARNDQLGEGDVIDVSVFEPGGTMMFSTSDPAKPDNGTTENLPHLSVARDGCVTIPFAGEVRVAGLTTSEAASAIQHALHGRAVDPQVQVALVGNYTNSVTVIGEVRNVGRVALSPYNEHILDILAAAGGPTKPPGDIMVTIVRGATQASTPLPALLKESEQNIRLAPHDQVRLLYAPRKYSMFGAFGRVSEQPIEDEGLTLAEAISRSGGLDTMTANAASVLLFRFERPEIARSLGLSAAPTPKGVPVIYRLNMMQPVSFFVANEFAVRANDLIYVPRSDSTELRKFLEMVSLISSITYNLTVTPVLK
ncbi:MAG TPA: polysaccharide biosynthesis/export family protein, partial [Caulobacteraceae bacterium]